MIAKLSLNLFLPNQSVIFLSSSGLLISIGFSINSLILASMLFFPNCSFSFLNCSFSFFNFSFSSFLTFSFSPSLTFSFFPFFTFSLSTYLCLFSTSCCAIIFSSLKISSDIEISSCSSQMSS